ncbi:hypothetical protein [Candidatus Binatus sp.]|uniref:hypothetical protein n=1 Tax=Candidatus Binatus sp. TaxID=2811406 RepID=UPI003BB0A70C
MSYERNFQTGLNSVYRPGRCPAVSRCRGLYSDWTDAGRSAELHIYRRGNHGFGMAKQGMPSDRWIDQFRDWLADLAFA